MPSACSRQPVNSHQGCAHLLFRHFILQQTPKKKKRVQRLRRNWSDGELDGSAALRGHLRSHSPQCDAGTWTDAALTSPLSFARPFVRVSIARSPMLNSFLDESITATVTVVGLPPASGVYVRFQHVPHSVESHPATTDAPPMNGNVGRSLNLLYPRVISPCLPFEHATPTMDVSGKS